MVARLVAVERLAHEVLDEQRHVVLALAQRRHAHAHHGEPVVEILAERAAIDLAHEVAIGRGDDAHVDGDDLRAADAADLALLERAQQLRLQLERQLADLVEEQRAAVRLFEAADALRIARR